MAEHTYECLAILDSNRYGREPDAVSGQIPEFVRRHNGEVLAHRLWEERRLAYPIDGHKRGTYWLTYFRLDSSHVQEIERQCRLSESILRILILKVEPRIADVLVEHARTGTVQPRAEVAAAAGAPAGGGRTRGAVATDEVVETDDGDTDDSDTGDIDTGDSDTGDEE